jgi:hypothetical protein
VATDKTRLTELGTAVGLVWDQRAAAWPASVEELDVPGLPRSVWGPVLEPALAVAAPQADRDLLIRALHNGQVFRERVLAGRRPQHIAWVGGARTTWTSDVPRDLTVDGVWFIQAKYDSTCVLNTSPGSMVDHLRVDDGVQSRQSWYEVIAPGELQAYYAAVRRCLGATSLPHAVTDLEREHRDVLKSAMRSRGEEPTEEHAAYLELCRVTSELTAQRWRWRLREASPTQRTQMLFRMLRIAGGPYWLLGTKGHEPVQLAVCDTLSWRQRFRLRRFEVRAADAGQPQVDWRARVEAVDGATHDVDGFCELRWSHGKLQGNPECKVQVVTPLADIPGYDGL